jgi:dihydropteroate synthase
MQGGSFEVSEETRPAVVLSDNRELSLSRPLVMGVLNVTPDSFSDGGKFADPQTAVSHALFMIESGADVIDIGGESSRPGAEPIERDHELRRVIPVIKNIRRRTDIPLSIDTYKAAVAEAAIGEGADIVNDISALRFDEGMAPLAARYRVPVILMHMLGTPRNMQDNPVYGDCVAEIKQFLADRVAFAADRGIDKSRMIIDPGIGFGKRLSDNLQILTRLRELRALSLPLLIGASRKSFIGMVHRSGLPADRRFGGSIAATVVAVLNGADIVRVHDVAETVEALRVVEAIRRGA